ncbi:EamA family transporter [Streptomyces sp. CA-132043]|uniref:EamA family transporter n=1 Tax=Streptomyces sp. CA-132043 TaxID=3240048 RepID=UPI003D9485FF
MPAKKGVHSPYLMLSVTMVLWGSAFASSKSVVAYVPHSVAALLRFGGAALALLVALYFLGDRRAAPKGAGRRAALAGVLGVFAYNSAFFWGFRSLPRSTPEFSSPS